MHFFQVIASQTSISVLSKPCLNCVARSFSHFDHEGRSDSSRNGSRRGSSSIQSGDNDRKNSNVVPQIHGINGDVTPAPLHVVQHHSPVSLSPEHPTFPSHTIVATSLRASTRKSVATQANGRSEHASEGSVVAWRDALQVVVSVKDR
jgi:hypothetical protein